MTETEWLASTDPQAMLRVFVGTPGETGRSGMEADPPEPPQFEISPRKLRLFAVACCQQVWHLLTDERSRNAVLTAERFADGKATEGERSAAAIAAHDAYARDPAPTFPEGQYGMGMNASAAACNACWHDDQTRAVIVQTREAGLMAVTQANLLREIVGNPWRSVSLCGNPDHGSVAVRPYCEGCQRLRTPSVLRLAEAAYRERLPNGHLDNERLAVLSDAVEEAGCPQTVEHYDEVKRAKLTASGRRVLCSRGCCFECPECSAKPGAPILCASCLELRALCAKTPPGRPHPLLAALRSPGEHFRGFWALDLVLGKG